MCVHNGSSRFKAGDRRVGASRLCVMRVSVYLGVRSCFNGIPSLAVGRRRVILAIVNFLRRKGYSLTDLSSPNISTEHDIVGETDMGSGARKSSAVESWTS